METKENKPTFEEIEPFCKWRKDENQEVLEVHLQGFKKEQLRVQISGLGVLTISGQRSVDENRLVRFRKEINTSKNCKKEEIYAKFSGGILYITMPLGSPSPAPETQLPTKPYQPTQENEKPKQEDDKDKHISNMPTAIAEFPSVTKFAAPKLGALAAVVVVAAVGLYVAYKYRQAFLV